MRLLAKVNDPTHSQRDLPVGGDFHRHLIGGSTDAARFYFKTRFDVLDCLVQSFQRIDRVGAFARLVNRRVNDLFGDALFALTHYGADQSSNCRTRISGVLFYFFMNYSATSRHPELLLLFLLSALGFFLTRFRALCTILGAAPPAPIDSETVKCAPNDVVAHTWQVFDSTTANKHD